MAFGLASYTKAAAAAQSRQPLAAGIHKGWAHAIGRALPAAGSRRSALLRSGHLIAFQLRGGVRSLSQYAVAEKLGDRFGDYILHVMCRNAAARLLRAPPVTWSALLSGRRTR
jgi:hypothetical protein